MKKKGKTSLCLLLALCMAALFLPQSLAAQEQAGSPTDAQPETASPATAAAPLQRNADPMTMPDYDTAVYSENDVNAINAIIDSNELDATKNAPEEWANANMVAWNDATPKRIGALNLSDEGLTGTLDVSGLTELTRLDCSDNELSGVLDLSALTALGNLQCENNQLTELNVGGLAELTELVCVNNRLSALNVSGCVKLSRLDCDLNQLTSLTLTGLHALKRLSCASNKITSLDLTGLPSDIKVESCNVTQFTDPSGKTLTIDPAQNGFAEIWEYNYSEEGKVQVYAFAKKDYQFAQWSDNTTHNPYSLELSQRSTTLAPSFTEATTQLYHQGDLDILEKLIVDHKLDGKAMIRLGYPDTYRMAVWDDSVQSNRRLIMLDFSGAGLTGSLDVSGLAALTALGCNDNQLTSLNVSGLTALSTLYCSGNQLTSLNVSGLDALTELYCHSNELTSLDLSGVTALTELACAGNQLTSLNVSDADNLQTFSCLANPLSSLKLPGGKSIEINVPQKGGIPVVMHFDYNSGTPFAIYTIISDPGYSGEWSNEHGCSISDTELTVDFGNNGDVTDVSATLIFERNESLTANPEDGKIDVPGLEESGNVKQGDTFTFTAETITTGAADPYNGDIQYAPVSWSVNPSGDFSTGPTQEFSTSDMDLGPHTLTVVYRGQAYNNGNWMDIPDKEISKTFTFNLVENNTPGGGDTPGGDTPGGNTPGGSDTPGGGNTSGGNTAPGGGQSGNSSGSGTGGSSANPGTGDSGYAWYIIGLLITGGALLLFARKKKTA